MFVKCFCLLDDVGFDIGKHLTNWVGEIMDQVDGCIHETNDFEQAACEQWVEVCCQNARNANAVTVINVLIEAGGIVKNEMLWQVGPAALRFDKT